MYVIANCCDFWNLAMDGIRDWVDCSVLIFFSAQDFSSGDSRCKRTHLIYLESILAGAVAVVFYFTMNWSGKIETLQSVLVLIRSFCKPPTNMKDTPTKWKLSAELFALGANKFSDSVFSVVVVVHSLLRFYSCNDCRSWSRVFFCCCLKEIIYVVK